MRALLVVQLENGFCIYPADHMQFQLINPATARMIRDIGEFRAEARTYFNLEPQAQENRWTFTTQELGQGVTQEIARPTPQLRPAAEPANPVEQQAQIRAIPAPVPWVEAERPTTQRGALAEAYQREIARIRYEFLPRETARRREQTQQFLANPVAVDPAMPLTPLAIPDPQPPPVWETPGQLAHVILHHRDPEPTQADPLGMVAQVAAPPDTGQDEALQALAARAEAAMTAQTPQPIPETPDPPPEPPPMLDGAPF